MNTLHTVLALAFVAVTGSLLVLTIARRLRVRRVVLSWRTTRPARLPVWPILFMGAVAVLNVYAANTTPEIGADVFAGYLVGAFLWLLSSILSGTVFVTEYGIVRDALRDDESIAWLQVYDYFEVGAGRDVVFVFMYEAHDATHRRLELPVPFPYVESFRRYLRRRLDDGGSIPIGHAIGRTALEG